MVESISPLIVAPTSAKTSPATSNSSERSMPGTSSPLMNEGQIDVEAKGRSRRASTSLLLRGGGVLGS